MQRTIILSLAVGCLALIAGSVSADPTSSAEESFASGQALLRKADFGGALEAFRAAAKADAKNQDYAQQYAMLRQVIRMRADLSKEKSAERWLTMVGALRTFYHDNDLHMEALPLDQERYRRLQTTESAVLLAETQLALDMNSQTAELLGGIPRKLSSPHTRVLHGLALAHTGNLEEANQTAKVPWFPGDQLGPQYFYDLARLRSLTGDANKALKALTRSFELTPPSRLEGFRTQARNCEDFSTLQGTAGFAEAMKTSSKIKESDCSKGSGCDKCPKQADCGNKGAENQKKTP